MSKVKAIKATGKGKMVVDKIGTELWIVQRLLPGLHSGTKY